jgi:hypothetical protein
VPVLDAAHVVQELRMKHDPSALLPIRIAADEAWLMVGSNSSTWETVRRIRFRRAG